MLEAGASAVALWTTLRLLPLEPGGEFAAGLEAGRAAALALHRALGQDQRLAPLFPPDLDINVWAVRRVGPRGIKQLARNVFAAAAERDLHLALSSFPRVMLEAANPVHQWDADEIVCLRACAMKPEHQAWMPEILSRLQAATGRGVRTPQRVIPPRSARPSGAPKVRGGREKSKRKTSRNRTIRSCSRAWRIPVPSVSTCRNVVPTPQIFWNSRRPARSSPRLVWTLTESVPYPSSA